MSANKRLLTQYKKIGSAGTKTKHKTTNGNGFESMPNLLMSAYNAWQALSQWRTDIRRNEEFVFGDQHSDRVYDYKNARYTTERQLFVEQGLQPSQYNIIRNVLRTVAGVWISNKTLPVCVAQKDQNQAENDVLTATLHAVYRKNQLWKLDYSQLVQLLLSGLMATDNGYANRDGDSDVVNDYIDPFTFFVDNNMKDPRYLDNTMVGYFYDLPVDSIAGIFSKGDKERAARIRELYRGEPEERVLSMTQTFTDERLEKDFFVPPVEAYGLGRVIKVWRKETQPCYWVHDELEGKYYPDFTITEKELQRLKMERMQEQAAMGVAPEDMLLISWEWSVDTMWKCYHLSPYGDVLDVQDNPFWHEKPSIIFELHEFFVGKIYPFVKDLIDTQKQINKLSAISELLSKYSAKSLMFMPIDQIANEEGYGIDYIEKNITNFDSVIPYKSKPGQNPPNFVNTVSQAFTPLNVVNMYLKLSENVSGVYGALQGAQPTAGTPAQMYAQQSQNSATSLNGIFEAANSFRIRRDQMNVQLMQQFYTSKRYIFDKDSGKQLVYDPEQVRNIEFEINVIENTDTSAYRLMVNDLLFQLKQYDTTNMLDLRALIEAGNLPFKDNLLNYLNEREQNMQQQGQLPPDMQQQLGGYQFNPELMSQFSQLPPETQQQIAN